MTALRYADIGALLIVLAAVGLLLLLALDRTHVLDDDDTPPPRTHLRIVRPPYDQDADQ